MSRLRNAWLALWGRLPLEKLILVEESGPTEINVGLEAVSVYQVVPPSYFHHWRYKDDELSCLYGHYGSCEDAFAAIPEKFRNLFNVQHRDAVRMGSRYFPSNCEFALAKKPKVAKGKKGKAS